MYESDTLDRRSVRSLHSTRSIQTAYSNQSLRTLRSYKIDVDRQSLSALHLSTPKELILVHPGAVEFRRQKNVDSAISNFLITFDEKDHYKPGQTIKGQVEMDVWTELDVRYVEFLLVGRGTVRMFTGSSSKQIKSWGEVYLDKRILLMSPSPGETHLFLKPGRYISKFSYKLPNKLAPTLSQLNLRKSVSFDISYAVQANVCDSLHNTDIPKHEQYVRVVKSCRRLFTVGLLHDWFSIPGATDPVIHAEQLQLSCAPSTGEPTSVLVHLNRGVYTPGDTMKVNVEAFTPNGKGVKRVEVLVEQHIRLTDKVKMETKNVLVNIKDKLKNRKKDEQKNMLTRTFSIPLPADLTPSYLPGCHLLKITYTMHVTTQFKSCSGKLVTTLPIHILQQSRDSQVTQEDGSMPVFSKPITQYPNFINSASDDEVDHNNGTVDMYSGTTGGRGTAYSGKTGGRGMAYRKVDDQQQKAEYTVDCCNCCVSLCGLGLFKD